MISAESPPVVAIGGSAGSIAVLRHLLPELPRSLPAAIVVTVHQRENRDSRLDRVLGHHGRLPVAFARHGEPLSVGAVHLAPPGAHLVIRDGLLHLSRGPRVNRHRPSVDVMLDGAAQAAGGRSIALVLSGVLDDGAVGAALVAAAGGQVLVQDPEQAQFPGMPPAARHAVPAARAATDDQLPAAVIAAVEAASARGPQHAFDGEETLVIDEFPTLADSGDPAFLRSEEDHLLRLSCPDCGGGLAELTIPGITFYRCHVGHQWSPESLMAAQAEMSETRLWQAVVALEEQAVLAEHRTAHHPQAQGPSDDEDQQATAARAAQLAKLLREHISDPSLERAPLPE